MENKELAKELVKELVKLQMLCIRYVERNTNLKCSTHRDIERVITSNKLSIEYKDAVINLKNNIEKYCKNEYLLKSVYELETNINNSELANLRFGRCKLTKIEEELDSLLINRRFLMLTSMVNIKYASDELGLTESAIKQACQQERLLNTQKIGKSWLVHIPECREYWNKPDVTEKNEDWIY